MVSWKPFEKSRNRILKPVHRCYDPDPHPSQNVTDPECYSIWRWERIGEEELAFWTWPVIAFYLWGLFGTDRDQDRITWGKPQKWCSDSLPFLMGHYRCTLTLCYQAQTPVWSESSVNEHNLYFARSAIIGYLAVETWRVKTELIIITILHIIVITTSILNLGFKTIMHK